MLVIIIKNTVLLIDVQNKLSIFTSTFIQRKYLVIGMGISLVENTHFIHHKMYQNQWNLC